MKCSYGGRRKSRKEKEEEEAGDENDGGLTPGWYYRTELLDQLRGKSIAFMGDSLTRQIWNRLIHWIRGRVRVFDRPLHTNLVYYFDDEQDFFYLQEDLPPYFNSRQGVTVSLRWVTNSDYPAAEARVIDFLQESKALMVVFSSGRWATGIQDFVQWFADYVQGVIAACPDLKHLAFVDYPQHDAPLMKNPTLLTAAAAAQRRQGHEDPAALKLKVLDCPLSPWTTCSRVSISISTLPATSVYIC